MINSEKAPLVSVITAIFNILKAGRKDTFLQALESVKAQDYKNIEHIIIDGASSDGTLEFLDTCKEKYNIKIFSEKDKGIYDAMNKGVKHASGKYIIFLNSDDFFHDASGIAYNVELLENSSAVFSYSAVRVFDEPTNSYEIHKAKMYNLFVSIPFCHQTMLTKREIFFKEGFFDDEMKISADYDFILRLSLEGYNSVLSDKIFATFRTGGSPGDNSKRILFEEANKIMMRNYAPLLNISPEKLSKIFWNYRFPLSLYKKIYRLIHPNLRKSFWKFVYKQLAKELFIFKTKKERKVIRLLGITFAGSSNDKH